MADGTDQTQRGDDQRGDEAGAMERGGHRLNIGGLQRNLRADASVGLAYPSDTFCKPVTGSTGAGAGGSGPTVASECESGVVTA